jgi:hypothetical protein
VVRARRGAGSRADAGFARTFLKACHVTDRADTTGPAAAESGRIGVTQREVNSDQQIMAGDDVISFAVQSVHARLIRASASFVTARARISIADIYQCLSIFMTIQSPCLRSPAKLFLMCLQLILHVIGGVWLRPIGRAATRRHPAG